MGTEIKLTTELELTEAERERAVAGALRELNAIELELTSKAHVVHQAKAYELTNENIEDDPDHRRYIGLEACPDCTRGLVSEGEWFRCVQTIGIPAPAAPKSGDLFACGRPS